jgi:hypothetical protein
VGNKKDQHTISLVSKLAKSGDVMINIEDGIIKVNSIKDGVKKTNKKQPTYNSYFKNIAILLIGLVSGFLLTISYINTNNTSNKDKNFLFGKNNAILNEQIILPIVSSFLPEEAFKVTKNQTEDQSIINAANYSEIDKIYNPLEILNDDDAVIPIAYYKNNYQADELRKKLEKKFNPIVFPNKSDNFDDGFILAVVCSDKQVDIVRKALSEKLEIPLPKWNKASKFKKRAGI